MEKEKTIEAIREALSNLQVKKIWKINHEGIKVKVVRKAEYAYDVYHNGHYVTTDETWERAFELTKVLLETPCPPQYL
jgi:hypothetical protein